MAPAWGFKAFAVAVPPGTLLLLSLAFLAVDGVRRAVACQDRAFGGLDAASGMPLKGQTRPPEGPTLAPACRLKPFAVAVPPVQFRCRSL